MDGSAARSLDRSCEILVINMKPECTRVALSRGRVAAHVLISKHNLSGKSRAKRNKVAMLVLRQHSLRGETKQKKCYPHIYICVFLSNLAAVLNGEFGKAPWQGPSSNFRSLLQPT